MKRNNRKLKSETQWMEEQEGFLASGIELYFLEVHNLAD